MHEQKLLEVSVTQEDLQGALKEAEAAGCGYTLIMVLHYVRMRGSPFYISRRDWERFGIKYRTGNRKLHRLEKRGLIEITASDGKALRVRLTAKTRRLLDKIRCPTQAEKGEG